jgi:hypothetical protein
MIFNSIGDSPLKQRLFQSVYFSFMAVESSNPTFSHLQSPSLFKVHLSKLQHRRDMEEITGIQLSETFFYTPFFAGDPEIDVTSN